MKQSLEEWAKNQFGKHTPCLATLRRWARDGYILPEPLKVGRKWLVNADASYVPPGRLQPSRPTMEQISRNPLIRRIMENNNGTPQNRSKSRATA
ncbi:excisionase [Aquitalea magnusonii]|uniref:excisionase n=1 Tax=Aquitalea magnusonii TaxID=332411 RepID=UPI0009E7F7EF